MATVVLITGVSRYLGGAFARLLSAQAALHGIERVLGIDVIPPQHDLGDVEFVRADIRGPMTARILEREQVDTVVHLNVLATPVAAGGRSSQKEINVLGTMQLLAACQKLSSLRRLVVKSSAAVYGSSPRDPAMFTEDMGPGRQPRAGFGKDSVEVEGYVRSLARRRPEVDVATLRMANVVGPRIRTGITDWFSLPVVPVPFGYAARLQFLHEDDALAALQLATTAPADRLIGTVNVAGDGAVTVDQAAAIAGRPTLPLPLPLTGPAGRLVRSAGLADFAPDQMGHLAYGRGMDTVRMRTVLRLEPIYTSREAFSDFVAHAVPPLPGRAALTAAGRALDGAAGRSAHALTSALTAVLESSETSAAGPR